MGHNKLPVFKPGKRLQRDKRYSNAQQISPGDSVSQYGDGVNEQYPQQHYPPQDYPQQPGVAEQYQYSPQHGQSPIQYGAGEQYGQQDGTAYQQQYGDQQGRIQEHASIAERGMEQEEKKHKGHMHGQSMGKLRKWLLIISMLLLLISIVFLILVLIAQIKPSVLPNTYFIKIDLTHIFVTSGGMPADVPFLNSVARSIGLHDYYQVGLWNYCSGYNDENDGNPGFCSKPVPLYWVNPVSIILSELLSGATIQLPGEIIDILDLIKLASNAMFGFFLTGIGLTAVYFIVLPLSLLRSENLRPMTRSCWVGFSIGTVGFFACLFTVAAAAIATVMFFIMANVMGGQEELNIRAEVGTSMLAFMWIGAGSLLIAWLLQSRCGCCCRKVRRESKERTQRRYGHQGEIPMARGGLAEKSTSNSQVGSLRERRSTTEMV